MKQRYEKERIDEYDRGVAENFGVFVELLASRTILSRKLACIFVLFNFYRRLMLPIVIIYLPFSPTLSMIMLLQINVYYLAFITSHTFYHDSHYMRIDATNELLVIISLYIIMNFLG